MSPRSPHHREEGYVIVVVLALLTVALGVGAAALAGTLASRSHANRDSRERRALQAADYGVQAVLLRENQLNLDTLNLTGGVGVLGSLADCVVPNVNTNLSITAVASVSVATSGLTTSGNVKSTASACPIAQGPGASGSQGGSTRLPVGQHDFYTSEFAPGETATTGGTGVSFSPMIASIGVDDNGNTADANRYLYARVVASLAPIDPFKTVEALHDLTFTVTAATLFNGTARAGDNVNFNGVGTFTGSNVLGPGNSVIGPTSIDYGCTRGGTQALGVFTVIPVLLGGLNQVPAGGNCVTPFFTRSPISIKPTKASCSTSCPAAGYVSGRNADGTANSGLSNENEVYNASGATSITLTPGTDYVFCSFNTSGPVTLPTGTTNTSLPVRIFIDSPTSSRCSGFVAHNGISAGSFSASQGIGGLVGGTANTLSPSQIQIYQVGNGTGGGTTFRSSGSVANAFFVYAPKSNITLSALSFSGNAIGYDDTISTTLYTQDVGLNNYPLSSSVGVFNETGYVQCPLNNTSNSPVTALTTTIATDTSGC
ncbi:MAG: hypothetical protein ACR2ND_11390 [Solirubrobacteraceae bacterium]